MTNYYFLSSALPGLEVGHPPLLHFDEFIDLVRETVTSEDFARVAVLLRWIDLQNLRAWWAGQPLDPRGALDEKEMEDALVHHHSFSESVFAFAKRYEKREQRLHAFSLLWRHFFEEEISRAQGFLKSYLEFEQQWRLVTLGFRAKLLGRDLVAELQFEDAHNPFVAHLLAQRDAKHYEPPGEYLSLKELYEKHQNHPLDLHKSLTEYRFNKVEELLEGDPFSIDRVLGYMTQLILVEQWQELDEEQGKEKVATIVRNAS